MMADLNISSLLLCAVSILIVLVWCNEAKDFQCIHERNPKMVVGVQIGKENQPVKRQSASFAPLRISVIYDSSVDGLTVDQRNRIQSTIMPAVESFFEEALMVIPATDPILLERDCVGGTFRVPIGDVRRCSQQCEPTTTCSVITIPEDHLKGAQVLTFLSPYNFEAIALRVDDRKLLYPQVRSGSLRTIPRCVQCNGGPNSGCQTLGVDGPGVNTDFILYVGTVACSNPNTLAFATACQLESSLDRPIAGIANFCPGQIDDQSDQEMIDTGIHEVLHTLGFSSTLYPYYRDENGDPRTPRDTFGFPPTDTSGFAIASSTTIRTEVYTDWQTRNGVINHEVQLLVTPNIIEQAMAHYNCPTLLGVEVENQGGPGTATSHWEQRLLGNEGMTGISLFNAPFSRITFGLLQDSGWYIPNYSMAEELAWGRNAGCRFTHGSCGEWIDTQTQSGSSLAPFCNRLRGTPDRLGCTVDRSVVSLCNLIDYGASPPPSEFQYFNSGPNFDSSVAPRVGGSLFSTDFCPFQNRVTIGGSLRECSIVAAQPTNNLFAETYGSGSRCVEHGRQWSRTVGGITTTSGLWGGGCYQHSCSVSTGVKIQVQDLWFQCDCEGEELVLDITVSDTSYQGSLICPSCAQICFDNTNSCPVPEPAACYGRETTAVPITEVGVGGDPHFSIVLPNNKMFCYTIQGEHGSVFNLISNKNLHMNALFVPNSGKRNATWIGALGVVIFNNQSSNTKLTFDGRDGLIHIGDRTPLAAKSIQGIHFHHGELSVSKVHGQKQKGNPSVMVSLDDTGLHFTVRFTRKHLEIFWQSVGQHSGDSHGLIGQFFRSGVEIDEVQRIVILPGKNPVPVRNRPLWGFMKHKLKTADHQHCWTAINHGEQGEGLIDGVYLDYLVNNILSDNFKFKQ